MWSGASLGWGLRKLTGTLIGRCRRSSRGQGTLSRWGKGRGMASVRQVNKFPIYTTLTELNTYEVECSSCEQLKWPSLPKRPDKTYVCALCRMKGPSKVTLGRQAAQR